MPELFPTAETPEQFESVRRDDDAFRAGVRAICDHHGLGGASVERFPEGSLPVYAIGDSLVLKLYPPYDLNERDTEAAVLRAVEGRLPIPTPALRATGELEGWGYLLMGRLRGISLAAAWPDIPDGDRLELASVLGESLAALHAIPGPEPVAARFAWNEFAADQQRTAGQRQRRCGLGEPWVSQIGKFLDRTPLDDSRPEALLHTEVMREHLLVERGGERWTLSGIFDFEPSMVGAPEYEFAAVGLFFSCGNSRMLRRVLAAYGYRDSDLDGALERRLLAYALLHRYSNLPWYLRRLPPPAGATSLEALAAHWWGVRANG